MKLMDTNSNNLPDGASLEDAQQLQLIESNPLSADEVAMFEMFEREKWSADRRRAYILDKIRKSGEPTAAE